MNHLTTPNRNQVRAAAREEYRAALAKGDIAVIGVPPDYAEGEYLSEEAFIAQSINDWDAERIYGPNFKR